MNTCQAEYLACSQTFCSFTALKIALTCEYISLKILAKLLVSGQWTLSVSISQQYGHVITAMLHSAKNTYHVTCFLHYHGAEFHYKVDLV